MKTLLCLVLLSTVTLCFQSGCRTAADATATGLDAGAHVADKSGRVLEHGARKVENNL